VVVVNILALPFKDRSFQPRVFSRVSQFAIGDGGARTRISHFIFTPPALPLVALYLLSNIAYQKWTNKMDKNFIPEEFATTQRIGMETLPSLFSP